MELSLRAIDSARGLRQRAGRTVRRLRDRAGRTFPDEADLLRFLGGRYGTLDEALRAMAAAPPPLLPHPFDDVAVRRLYAAHPERRTRLLRAADDVLAHRFDLLGSGPVTLGPRLPWHEDFVARYRFDAALPFEALRDQVTREFGRGRDVKIPWELSRFQHLARLGQAFRLTGLPVYYEEFRAQVTDWIESNPVAHGVNWTCTMDVAIRAVNWIWAWSLFQERVAADRPFASLILRALLVHGRFIAGNLEKGSGPASNHYFADLMGLLATSLLFRDGGDEAREWLSFAASEIAGENEAQTYPDGVDYEASIPYHRLMSEMALTATLLLDRKGRPEPALASRVRRMVEFTAHYTKPSGLAPQVGDNDDGRLQILGEPDTDRRDHRALLAVAGCFFDDPALFSLAGDRWEEAVWIVGAPCVEAHLRRPSGAPAAVTGARFPDAGIAVLRHADLFAIMDAGPVGLKGDGAHAHNDTLSFEIQAGGEDLIVDPGTGGYTRDLALRDRFRSTAGHNSVRVDGEEINPIPPTPFSLPGVDRPAILRAQFRRNFDMVEAVHRGYERLADPVRHRRVLLLNRSTRRFVIEDRLEGEKAHRLEWFFHLAPGVSAELDPTTAILLGRTGTVRFAIEATMRPPGARLQLVPDAVSPGYGRVVPSQTLVCEWEGDLPVVFRFAVTVSA